MNRLSKCLSLTGAVAYLLLFACSEDQVTNPPPAEPELLKCGNAANGGTSKKVVEAEFEVHIKSNMNGLPAGGCGSDFVTASFTGTSHLSSIGTSEIVLAHCQEVEANGTDPRTYNVLNGWLEVENDQGDRFSATYLGEIVEAARDTLKGSFLVVEGDGQFSNANGQGCFRAVNTGLPGEFLLELKGEL